VRAVEPVLTQAADASAYGAARVLFEEYAAEIKIDLCFQGFAAELGRLPEMYGPPSGCLLLAQEPGAPAVEGPVGCGAVRRLSPDRCEMKRLYVRPPARRSNLGRLIAQALILQARDLGYTRMLLDTLESMIAARTLYYSLGFRETVAYYSNPLPDVVYMALDL